MTCPEVPYERKTNYAKIIVVVMEIALMLAIVAIVANMFVSGMDIVRICEERLGPRNNTMPFAQQLEFRLCMKEMIK